jgi:hypothetical protein
MTGQQAPSSPTNWSEQLVGGRNDWSASIEQSNQLVSSRVVDGEVGLPGDATTQKMIILSFLDDPVPKRSSLTEPSSYKINIEGG